MQARASRGLDEAARVGDDLPDRATGTLVIKRQRGFFDAWRGYRVVIDGHAAGNIDSGTSETFELPAGSHQAQLRIDWTGSEPVPVKLEPGGRTILRVEYVGRLLSRTKYLRLVPDSAV